MHTRRRLPPGNMMVWGPCWPTPLPSVLCAHRTSYMLPLDLSETVHHPGALCSKDGSRFIFLLLLIGPLWIRIENYFHFQPLFCHVMQKAIVEREMNLSHAFQVAKITLWTTVHSVAFNYSPSSCMAIFKWSKWCRPVQLSHKDSYVQWLDLIFEICIWNHLQWIVGVPEKAYLFTMRHYLIFGFLVTTKIPQELNLLRSERLFRLLCISLDELGPFRDCAKTHSFLKRKKQSWWCEEFILWMIQCRKHLSSTAMVWRKRQ